MNFRILFAALFAALTLPNHADGPGAIGNFGPTGIEIDVKRDGLAHVTEVQPGSPADGMVKKGDLIAMVKNDTEGRNVIAAMSFMQYFRGTEGGIDVQLEGLREFPETD